MKSTINKFAELTFNHLPTSILSRVESFARVGQGKGWGANTVTEEVEAALSLLKPHARKSLIALDVGANIGSWTSALVDVEPSAIIYAFEPSMSAFGRLQQSLADMEHVHLMRTALGSVEGTATLFADAAGSGLASLTKRRLDHFHIEFEYSEEVFITTLDRWVDLNHMEGSPSLLKMDVEGHELDVLKGAEYTLRTIDVVQFEFGGCNIDTRTYFQDYFYFFRNAGFSLFRLGPKGLENIPKYTEIDESFTTTNYYAQRT